MTLQIFWPKLGNPMEGGQKRGTNGREGREGGSRGKPGNQLVYIYNTPIPRYNKDSRCAYDETKIGDTTEAKIFSGKTCQTELKVSDKHMITHEICPIELDVPDKNKKE